MTVATDLRLLGFPAGKDQIINFQAGWALGDPLVVDGIAGAKTKAALAASLVRLRAHKPTASQWFSFGEFACHCTLRACPKVWVKRGLLLALDQLRATAYPSGLSIVSGCRCWPYHQAIYKARGEKVTTQSLHLVGMAADIPAARHLEQIRGLHLFGGLGYQKATGNVRHVDVRQYLPSVDPRRASATRPTEWPYS